MVGAVFVDELDLANADLLVDARTFLGGGLRGSDGAANGAFLLFHCKSAEDREFFGSSQRQCTLARGMIYVSSP
jgi:hypothetical protein